MRHPDAQWIIVGWGGRAFYLETPTWADLKPLPVLRALTVDRSVQHVDITTHIQESDPAISAFDVDRESLENLLDFIADSFVRDAGAVVPIPGTAYGVHDHFFEANGFFNALFGCNTWTAGALRAAGLRTGLWNPVPQSLALSLRLFN